MRPVFVGILSIGEMGLGIAQLLKSHGYRVLTVGEGRRYYCYECLIPTTYASNICQWH